MNHLKRSFLLFLAVLFLCLSATLVHASSAETVSAETTLFTDDGPSNSQELFDEYVYRLLYGTDTVTTYKRHGRDQLSASEKHLYDFLKKQIVAVSSGQTSTEFNITAAQLSNWGIQSSFSRNPAHSTDQAANAALSQFLKDSGLENIITALLHDCPYELYWYDKESGVKILGSFSLSSDTVSIRTITFRFTVVLDMQADSPYAYNATQVNAATAATENAKKIVKALKKASDIDKLYAYKNEICSLVTYNSIAASNGNFSLDADPWQIIYVFDKNPSTNVVCEGYSKAFQYLCDLSDLGSSISCITVSGFVPSGAHMWNIIRINDRSYLADVTNSDTGSFGSDGSLFLVGATGTVTGGYEIKGQSYVYNNNTLSLWGTDSNSCLNISSSNLNPCVLGHNIGEWTVTQEPTCSVKGIKTGSCQRSGCNYTDTEEIPTIDHEYTPLVTEPTCTEKGYTTYTCDCGDSYKDGYVDALEHDMGKWTTTKEATCSAQGSQTRSCQQNGCDHSETEKIPTIDHQYTSVVTEPSCGKKGYTTHTCTCGDSYQASEVPPTDKHTYSNSSDESCNVCGKLRQTLQPMYRVYNPYTHEHLLSGNASEKDLLISIGWSLDGIAWKAPNSGTHVYRLYNPYDDWHTYSISQDEIDILTALGWTVDGVVTRSADKKEGTPIYRLFNPFEQKNYHLFTASKDEVEFLTGMGWILEGVAWYGLT